MSNRASVTLFLATRHWLPSWHTGDCAVSYRWHCPLPTLCAREYGLLHYHEHRARCAARASMYRSLVRIFGQPRASCLEEGGSSRSFASENPWVVFFQLTTTGIQGRVLRSFLDRNQSHAPHARLLEHTGHVSQPPGFDTKIPERLWKATPDPP